MSASDVAASPARPTIASPQPRAIVSSPMADYYMLILAVAVLVTLGELMVLSSSAALAQAAGKNPYYYSIQQLLHLGIGVIAAVLLSRLPADLLRRLGWVAWGLALVLLMLIFTPMGYSYQGNRNWLRIAGFTFQPSEFAKLALIVWSAAVLHVKRKQLHDPARLVWPFVPGAAVILALILAERDVGTGLVVGFVILALLFFVGVPYRVLVPATLFAGVVVGFLIRFSDSRMSRIQVFLDPQSNPDLASQPLAALYAMATGGWWGTGLGAGRQKWGGLKDGVHTDFIFAVIGEELGLFGVVLLVIMFALIARAGLSIALKSDRMFNRLVAAGIVAWFLAQAIVNMAVVMHLVPVLGVPLPFVSSGGSALVASLMAVGVLLSLARDTPAARRHLRAQKRKAGPRLTSVMADRS